MGQCPVHPMGQCPVHPMGGPMGGKAALHAPRWDPPCWPTRITVQGGFHLDVEHIAGVVGSRAAIPRRGLTDGSREVVIIIL